MALFQQCASTRANSTSRTRPGKWHVIRNVSVPMLRLVPTDVSPSKSNMRRKNKREWGVGEERIVVVFWGGQGVCCQCQRRKSGRECWHLFLEDCVVLGCKLIYVNICQVSVAFG